MFYTTRKRRTGVVLAGTILCDCKTVLFFCIYSLTATFSVVDIVLSKLFHNRNTVRVFATIKAFHYTFLYVVNAFAL
ncbi:hypothetical protein BsWGS_17687 [Bradybaena similaris]